VAGQYFAFKEASQQNIRQRITVSFAAYMASDKGCLISIHQYSTLLKAICHSNQISFSAMHPTEFTIIQHHSTWWPNMYTMLNSATVVEWTFVLFLLLLFFWPEQLMRKTFQQAKQGIDTKTAVFPTTTFFYFFVFSDP